VFGLQVFDVLDKTSIQIRSGNFNEISYSILIHMQWYENHNLYETEYRIRFKTVWNGFCTPFLKKFANFFMKRNTESVSKLYETDSVFRFIKKFANFFRNGIQNPFHTVLKRILYSVSHTFWIPNNPFKQIQFTNLWWYEG